MFPACIEEVLKKGLTVRQLARMLKVKVKDVRSWQSGKSLPSERQLRWIGYMLGLSPEALQGPPFRPNTAFTVYTKTGSYIRLARAVAGKLLFRESTCRTTEEEPWSVHFSGLVYRGSDPVAVALDLSGGKRAERGMTNQLIEADFRALAAIYPKAN